ncbi:MAG: signal peptidase I [Rhodobiaceae bacterium]|nr:signal peptidase I [Rhodobiaceae bacterium]
MSSVTDEKDSGGIGETIRVIIHALLIALVIRTLLFQPFSIPSGSMEDTLLIGDYLFVSKYAYGYSRHSLPFSPPIFSGRVWASEPKRGDIAVFKLPRDGRTDYIKRVIGLPGDRIQVRGGVVFINGQEVPRERLEDVQGRDPYGRTITETRYRETLPNGVTYEVLDEGPGHALDDTPVYEVPAGHYFMMGDNRDNSTDSRVLNAVGYVPFENFVGRAEITFFSLEQGTRAWEVWKWPTAIRWDRFFILLR